MGEIYIRAREVGLEVPHFVQPRDSAKSWRSALFAAATRGMKRGYRTLLSDLSFEVSQGDRLALLGRNGAGKTTLLRVLAGTLQPTSGALQVSGTRQALLNLGLGFNSEATVKENIFLRGTAMGMRHAQIRDLSESILDFAGLSAVANHRMATLSSGQRMRLGFSVSTAVQHDIMLLDEWFGAGDAEFVEKARSRMSDRVAGSSVVVLASHNFKMLRQVCSKGLVIDAGRATFFGGIEEAIEAYKQIYQATSQYQEYRQARAREATLSPEGQMRAEFREARRALREEKADIRSQRLQIREEKIRLRKMKRKLKDRAARLKAKGAPVQRDDGGGSR